MLFFCVRLSEKKTLLEIFDYTFYTVRSGRTENKTYITLFKFRC